MEWHQFYDNFYDWSNSTRKKNIRTLTSFGSVDEVVEIATELAFFDSKLTSWFLCKAVDKGIKLHPSDCIELAVSIDKAALNKIAITTSEPFSHEQLDEICGLVDDSVFDVLLKRSGAIKHIDEANVEAVVIEPQSHQIGIFSKLFMAIGVAAEGNTKKHLSKCTGDCTHCPNHYGYRYGRWYYGHGHQHGCEFGGNKGSD